MKLIQFKHWYDYGHEYCVQLLNTSKHYPEFIKRSSVLQLSVGWSDYPCGPYLQIHMGQGRLFGVIFFVYKFSFDADILAPTWCRDYEQDR